MSTKLTIEAWADIVIKEWQKKIEKYNIGNTGQLARSFVHHIISSSGGDPERIQFAYEYYGNFIDWGAGKGVPVTELESLQTGGMTTRKKKPWFTEVFYVQVKILAEELAEKYAEESVAVIKKGV